jgi:hypothetical protein
MNGTTSIAAVTTNVAGTACPGGGTIAGGLNESAPVYADPLASLPAPTFNAALDLGTIGGAGAYAPGYYKGGIDLNGGTAVLAPGTYVLEAGIHMNGQSLVTDLGGGVLLYVPAGSGEIDLQGGSGLALGPQASGTYEGVTIFQDRANTNGAELAGNGVMNVLGAIYLPAATLSLVGTSGMSLGQLITNELDVRGNATITGIDIPPGQAPGPAVLVQ